VAKGTGAGRRDDRAEVPALKAAREPPVVRRLADAAAPSRGSSPPLEFAVSGNDLSFVGQVFRAQSLGHPERGHGELQAFDRDRAWPGGAGFDLTDTPSAYRTA